MTLQLNHKIIKTFHIFYAQFVTSFQDKWSRKTIPAGVLKQN